MADDAPTSSEWVLVSTPKPSTSKQNMDNVDQPNSIYHVEQISMYPLQSSVENVPFGLLAGECGMHSGVCVDGSILITNYRLYLQSGKNHHHIPLGLIEVVESRELFYLHIGCKDARSYRCTFENNEVCLDWCNRIQRAVEPPPQLNQLFAFYHCIWSQEKNHEEASRKLESQRKYIFDKEMFDKEMTRLQFNGDSWRITLQNENYELCSTYPPYILVPSCISESQVKQSAKFRASRRLPAAVWRHTGNGAVIARCSQPEVGWLSWKSAEDEELLKGILGACNYDKSHAVKNGKDIDSNLSCSPESVNSDGFKQIKEEETPKDKKLLIIDARSYTTAVANRARGGGYEFCPDYYPNCEIQFMNLANIHSIRKSFHALRLLCASPSDIPNWFSQLENTRWLSHMSGLLRSAVTLVTAVETDERPVLVHCSDGWDRTPQIVALGELLLDPYYRTLEGFRTLIEREWLAFGHKFADRCGSSGCDDQNERCPVFLQWLDCVHQLLWQFPCEFEFTQAYLVKLAQHIYSGLFGTFLCNTQQERLAAVKDKTFSVWDFLNSPCFRNHLYKPEFNTIDRKVLWPQYNIRELQLWSEVFIGSMEENFMREDGAGYHPCPPECSHRLMNRTRSFGDLHIAGELLSNQYRRNSDPNVNTDSNVADLEPALPQENNAPTQGLPILNGHQTHTHLRQPDFYPSDLEDADNLTDDQIDDLEQANYERPSSITNGQVIVAQVHNHDEGDSEKVNFLGENVITCETERIKSVLNSLNSVSLNGVEETAQNGDADNTEHSNNDNSVSVPASDVAVREVEDRSEPDSATVEFPRDGGSAFLDVGGSIETSTDTLVSDCNFISSSPKEINGFEKIQSPVGNSEMTDGCAQIIKFNQGAHSHHYGRDQRTRYSSSPYSNSSNGWDNTLHNLSQQKNLSYQYTLGEDGLIPLRCVVQERLEQIVDEQKRKVDLLEKELHVTRQNLIKQSCHRCNHIDIERQDDNSDSDVESTNRSMSKSLSCSPQRTSPLPNRLSSVVESVFSASEGQASAGESQRSDLSWVAVEEASLADCQTLWVPDHAVSRCTGCGTEFWLGRRRHHCRKCGKIFCADCSENSTPLPSEQLYNPVRVCTGCYSELRRDCGEIPNQCKHSNTQTTNTNPQIAASSN